MSFHLSVGDRGNGVLTRQVSAVLERAGTKLPMGKPLSGMDARRRTTRSRQNTSLKTNALEKNYDPIVAAAALQGTVINRTQEGDLLTSDELVGDTFWPVINSQPKEKLVVVFCYTSGCGACRATKPKIALWKQDLKDEVLFFNFGLTLENKERALELGVKTAPAFIFMKSGTVLSIVKGGNNVHMAKQMIYANKK